MPILGSFTCKNNAHSKRADAQLLGKDGKEGGDGSRSGKEEKEMALCYILNFFSFSMELKNLFFVEKWTIHPYT